MQNLSRKLIRLSYTLAPSWQKPSSCSGKCCLWGCSLQKNARVRLTGRLAPSPTGLTQHRWAGTACRWRPARQPKRMYDPLNTRLINESSAASVSHLLLSPCATVWRSLSGTNLTPPMPNRDLMSRSRGVDNVCHIKDGTSLEPCSLLGTVPPNGARDGLAQQGICRVFC
jgi:hypothetical protein